MLLGFVSDAHGNSEGLFECLDFLKKKGTDRIYFLGDAVGYMPDWAGVFALLDEYEVQCLQGNHDYMATQGVIDPRKNLIYKITQDLVDTNFEHLSKVASLPSFLNIDFGSKELLLVHGSPWQPFDGYLYQDTPVQNLEFISANAVFMGHTHRPFIKWVDDKCLINVGSCGLPRDVGNLASCVIYDVEKSEATVYRIPFDVNKVIKTYKDLLHKSVVDCLLRKADNYFGVLVG